MNNSYAIDVWSNQYYVKQDLHMFSPKTSHNGRCLSISGLTKEQSAQIEKYCKSHKIRCDFVNPAFTRGSSYRRTFFSANKGIGGHYFCAYCGKRLPKEMVTVDHIVPIGKVKNNRFRQCLLKKVGIDDINCEKNLTASCRSCNLHKSDKEGLWIIRGLVGKNQYLWIARHIIRFLLLSAIVFIVFSRIF